MYAKLSSRTLWLFMCSISICLNSGLMSLSNETGIFSLPADVSYCSSPLESCDAAAAETNPGPFCASCNFSINIGRNLGSDRIRRPLAGDLLQERNHAVIQFPRSRETAFWRSAVHGDFFFHAMFIALRCQ